MARARQQLAHYVTGVLRPPCLGLIRGAAFAPGYVAIRMRAAFPTRNARSERQTDRDAVVGRCIDATMRRIRATTLGAAVNPLGDHYDPLAVIWGVLGTLFGALAATLGATALAQRVRRAQRLKLRKRDVAVRRLTVESREQRAQIRRQDEQLQELAVLRSQKTSLVTELEESRRNASALQVQVDAVRVTARETESRLNVALELERQETATRRNIATAELASAIQTTTAVRAELGSVRDEFVRTQAQLQSSLEAARQQVQGLTAALGEERLNTTDARRELRAALEQVEQRSARLAEELDAERRRSGELLDTERRDSGAARERDRQDAAARLAATEQSLATLREAYSLACGERDAEGRELAAQHMRVRELEGELERLTGEFAEQLDAEHLVAADLLSRVWNYVHRTTPRRSPVGEQPRWLEVPRPPEPSVRADEPPPSEGASVEESFAQWMAADEPTFRTTPADATPPEEIFPAAPEAFVPAPLADAPPDQERDVPEFFGLADVPLAQAWSEDPLADWGTALAAAPESAPPPAADGAARKPIFAMHLDDEVLVICDDGSVWTKHAGGWSEERSVPGTAGERTRGADEEQR